jgi:hypothetical protein
MTRQLKDYLEDMKVSCPSCPHPHNLSSPDVERILRLVDEKLLGYTTFGFVDQELWADFIDTYFFRSGVTEGEEYSSKINRNISGAALCQTLDELHKQLLPSPPPKAVLQKSPHTTK